MVAKKKLELKRSGEGSIILEKLKRWCWNLPRSKQLSTLIGIFPVCRKWRRGGEELRFGDEEEIEQAIADEIDRKR
ncbi:hypothetical protein L2E82_36107 [Cichorium intybus]|uniref:Uncharacterized protein n=1 Tax=Cichorium intybus TaxID=13427 RepID=A0ACB9BQQ3_CICIN|nr:hypothetical protein L2E82_36107 [Cichorium intybus]